MCVRVRERVRVCTSSRTEEGGGGDDSVAYSDDDGDAGLEEGHGEVDDLRALLGDGERRQAHVRLAVHERAHQPVPPRRLQTPRLLCSHEMSS